MSRFHEEGHRSYMMLWRTVWDTVKLSCGTRLAATYR